MWNLAGQRYLSASRELSLPAEDHRPVHKLITDAALKNNALYNRMSSNATPAAVGRTPANPLLG